MKRSCCNSKVQLDALRRKLLDGGAEKLVDALLELAVRNTAADELVTRLVSGKSENLKRYYQKLEELHLREYYFEWKQRQIFISMLEEILMLLEDGASTPEEGLKGIFALFEADADMCESCHDDGETGMFLEYDACNLLIRFAVDCEKKDWIADEVLRLCRNDNYGCRGCLIERASEYLPETQLRRMIGEVEKLLNSKDKWHWESHLKKLARQVRDQKLLEASWRQSPSGNLPEKGIMELAEVCFENNETDKALAWLKQLPKNTSYDYEKNELLENIYRKSNNKDELAALLLKKFKSRRDPESLQELLDIVGEEQRAAIIEKEVRIISRAREFEAEDIDFLLRHDRSDKAIQYIFKHANGINGDDYYLLNDLAEKLSALKEPLAASLFFRAMLDSILERGKTAAYHHGVEYLNQLDLLAGKIDNWNGFKFHQDYFGELKKEHGRKYSFWEKYK